MTRIHPDHTQLIDSMIAERRIDEASKVPHKAVQYWADVLTQEIGPQRVTEMPFIIAALRMIADSYTALFPGTGEAAELYLKTARVEAQPYMVAPDDEQ